MAWLRATPKNATKSRWELGERLLPPLGDYEYIIRYLDDMGYTSSDSNGMRGFSWCEVESFFRLHFNYYPNWLPRLLHKLSTIYASQAYNSREVTCIQPYLESGEKANSLVRSSVDAKLRELFK